MTPPAILSHGRKGAKSAADWAVRVVPNKFPALRIEENQMSSLLDQESRRLLREAIPRLPKRQKQALTLKLQNDWKYERIAQEMGTSVGSVKAHIFHAIQNLTRYIHGAKP